MILLDLRQGPGHANKKRNAAQATAASKPSKRAPNSKTMGVEDEVSGPCVSPPSLFPFLMAQTCSILAPIPIALVEPVDNLPSP